MSNTYTETTRQSWLSRVGGSIAGVLVGLVMIVAAFPLLWWNEGRAIKTARGLAEGAGAVVSVTADNLDAAHEGALVHVSGLASTEETLTDPELGVSAPALKLVRRVEMFQWREEKKSEKRKKLGGSEETFTTYSYSTTWSGSAIDSSSFKQPADHRNPGRLPWDSRTITASRVTLGAFALPGDLVAQISSGEPLRVDQGAQPREAAAGLAVVDGGFYRGRDPGAPAIGDVRIRYELVKPQTVSVVAVQRGNSFEAYQTKTGTSILMLEEGTRAADAMFKSAQSKNTLLAWLLRGGGLLLMFLGFVLLLRPIAVLGSVLPFVGSLLSGGIGLVSFLVALTLSLVTVSLAWLFYRPLLAIGLIGLAALAVALISRRHRALKRAAQPPPLPAQGPPRMTPPPLPPAGV